MLEQISDEKRAMDDAEGAASTQPEPHKREAVLAHMQPTRGRLGDFLHAINRPWLLITLPVLILLFSRRAARPAPQQAVAAPAE